MTYKVWSEDEDGTPLFTSDDKKEAFAKAREFDATDRYAGNVWVEDSDGKIYEDLSKF
jgi:hypothetical protein